MKIIIALIITVIITASVVILVGKKDAPLGSVSRSSEYHATTTSSVRFQPETLLLTGNGTLGSVVITGAAAGVMNLYDATTSNIDLRTNNLATTSIYVASFPASAAAGTYTFDRILIRGLYVSIIGTMPTSTITWRE